MTTFGIVSAFYKPHMGGVEAFTENLALQLIRMGHKVVIITSLDGAEEPIEQLGDLSIVRLSSGAAMRGRFPFVLPGRKLKEAEAWLAKQGVEGILVNTRYYPISLFGLRFARRYGIPAIVLDHSSGPLSIENPLVDFVLHAYERMMTLLCKRYAPTFYAVSEQSARWLLHNNIDAAGFLHNAIDADEFTAMASSRDFFRELCMSPDAFLVSYAGRLLPEKGAIKVAQAVAKLSETNPDIHVAIAGEGPAEEDLLRVSSDNVHFVGRLDKADLAALLSQSKVFCFPSDYPEGLPTVLLEAAACECALIVSQTGGAEEIVPTTQFGIILDSTEPSVVQSAILQMYANSSTCDLLARNAKRNVCDSFTWKRTAEAFLEAFAN